MLNKYILKSGNAPEKIRDAEKYLETKWSTQTMLSLCFHANMKNRLRFTVGKGEGGMTWESSIETYTLPYIKYIASGNLLYDAENSKQVLCNNLDVWDREEV